jgi:ADP-ribose pyrophosphatase
MTPHFSHNDYEIINREVMYDGIFRLSRYTVRCRLFNNGFSKPFIREVVERRSAVALLPYDPNLDRIILIEQFRVGGIAEPTGPWLTEVIAGTRDTKEAPDEIAIRESQEEAGCEITEIELINDFFVSPGGSNEYMHIYCGKADVSNVGGVHGLVEENEDIRVLNLPAEEAFARIHNNEIKTAPAIIALQWLELNRGWLRDKWS